ncbi:NAD(P)-binding oxidoreductase [Bacteroides fluxus]|uniref:NAD(P)-binding domain-containing protein n=1 Tax=Bacteroides fluxus YIT 12057 TaxID=763034 RepID=F3PW83_9BACE|nr:NAD(P)-binding oxidoreductase [Bacteroides fluxus]EGF52432.1 hypothetical protein HMPREF9446_03018 [Bacteroides fluxus YIT 12057]
MKHVILFGVTGSIGNYIIKALETLNDVRLTLFVRNSLKLSKEQKEKHRIIEGDVMNYKNVKDALKGQDIVYFGLSGNLDAMVKNIIKAMKETDVKKIIAISSMGIYGASWKATLCRKKDAPGFLNSIMLTVMKPMFRQHRKLADIVENSGLDYTILRPGRFTYDDEISYQITYKGEPELGRDISRKSIAHFVMKIVKAPEQFTNQNISLTKGV